MAKSIIVATIIAIGLAAMGFFIGGRYTAVSTAANSVTRLDRLTGEVSMCIASEGCGWTLDAKGQDQAPSKPQK